jgi:hypothetical protein
LDFGTGSRTFSKGVIEKDRIYRNAISTAPHCQCALVQAGWAGFVVKEDDLKL